MSTAPNKNILGSSGSIPTIAVNEVLDIQTELVFSDDPVRPDFVNIEGILHVIAKHQNGKFSVWNNSGVVQTDILWKASHLHSEQQEPLHVATTAPDPGSVPVPPHGTKSVIFPPQYTGAFGDMRMKPMTTSDIFQFSFVIPVDLIEVVSFDLVGNPDAGAAGAGKGINLTSDYAADGEHYQNHSESDLGTLYNLGVFGQWIRVDLTSVLSDLAAGDRGGVTVSNHAIGGTLRCLGILLIYR